MRAQPAEVIANSRQRLLSLELTKIYQSDTHCAEVTQIAFFHECGETVNKFWNQAALIKFKGGKILMSCGSAWKGCLEWGWGRSVKALKVLQTCREVLTVLCSFSFCITFWCVPHCFFKWAIACILSSLNYNCVEKHSMIRWWESNREPLVLEPPNPLSQPCCIFTYYGLIATVLPLTVWACIFKDVF